MQKERKSFILKRRKTKSSMRTVHDAYRDNLFANTMNDDKV